MMTGLVKREHMELVSIHGMLPDPLQHTVMDVEQMGEIHLAVTVKMMCMVDAVAEDPQEVAVEDMLMGGQPWTITKTVFSGIQRRQNGPVGSLQRYTGILVPTIEVAMLTDCAEFITRSTGKSLRNVFSRDISVFQAKLLGSIGNPILSISTLVAGYQ